MEEPSTSVPTSAPIENPESVKESQIRNLMNDLYKSSFNVQAESASASGASEPKIISLFIYGYNKGFHKKGDSFELGLANYIDFIMDQIFINGIKYGENDEYTSAILLLTGIIVGTSIKLNIHINKILGVIVLGHGHGRDLTITEKHNISLNENVDIIDFIHTVAEETSGSIFSHNVAKAFALKLYEKSGESLCRTEKQFFRDICSNNFIEKIEIINKRIARTENIINQMKSDLKKGVKYKKQNFNNNILINYKTYYEENGTGHRIENIFKKLQENPKTHIDEYYNLFIKKLENDITELNNLSSVYKKSINTDKMLRSRKTENKEKKLTMCENIQFLSSDDLDYEHANIYTLFYLLPEFNKNKSYSVYSYIIQYMINRIFKEFQKNKQSLVESATNTPPTTIFQNTLNGLEQFKKEIPETTNIYNDFAFFKDQPNIKLNTDGFSYLFMTCLYQIINTKIINIREANIFKTLPNGEKFINPANFMSMIGKIVPNIKTTYIHNSCRETNTDNPEFIVSSSENTPNVSPSGSPPPRKSEKRTHDESTSESQNKTRRVSPGTEEDQSNSLNSSALGGSRRRKFRRSTRRKHSNKSYRKYSIGNGRRTK
jgi:hypothetical protein